MQSSKNRLTLAAAAGALALSMALSPAFATASTEMLGKTLGTNSKQVTASLKKMGYTVRRFENEDGMLEGYAMKSGKRYEVYVDTKTGVVKRFKLKN